MKSILFDFQHNIQIFNTKSGAEGTTRFTWNKGLRRMGAILLFEKSCNFDWTHKMCKTVASFTKETRKSVPPRGPGKLTKTVKETVLAVFTELQGEEKHNLKAFAEKYPRDFYQIAAKLIPTDIKADVKHTGKVILQIKRGQRNND